MNSIKHPWRYLLLSLATAILLLIIPLKSPVGWALPTAHPQSWYPDSGWAPKQETLIPPPILSQSLSKAFPTGHWEREKRGENTPPAPLKRGVGGRQSASATLQSPSSEGLGVGLPIASIPTVDDVLDQGQSLYDTGRFADAIAPWQQALALAEQQDDQEGMAIAHNYLAIGYQALAQWNEAQESVTQGLNVSASLNTPNSHFLHAQLLTTQGNGQLQIGDANAALESWQQAESLYDALDATEPLLRVRINQAQALRTLGFYRQAQETLEQVNDQLHTLPDSLTKLRGLQSLGQTLYRAGDLDQAKIILTTGMNVAHTLNRPVEAEAIQFQLAQIMAALGETENALEMYQQLQHSRDGAIALNARLHKLALETQHPEPDWSLIKDDISTLYPQLTSLPPSRWSINAQIYFAQLTTDDIGIDQFPTVDLTSHAIANLLAQSIQQAETLGDRQAEASALGQLGHLYEQTQQWSAALALTDQAISKSPTRYPTYDEAQLQWQKGRLLKAQYQTANALNAYESAVTTLSRLQHDLVAMNPDAQYSFRDQVEPIYREFVQLLLSEVDTLPTKDQQFRLQKSRDIIERLQLVELENFFREACLTYQTRAIDTIDPNAAVIYPIFLDQRLEVILALPNQPLQHYGVDFATTDHEDLFETARSALHPLRSNTAILPVGQQLYDWMIRPAEEAIAQAHIETLVFVPDGFLRNIPMAVLHDGDRFLIESYNVALTPGMQLLNSQPIGEEDLNVLTAGLTDARQGFNALPGVGEEIKQIQELVSANVLLNDTFTQQNVVKQVEQDDFSVIHLATHGQFSASADETFLLTWDDRINVGEFSRLFQSTGSQTPVELLVLSACQTAEGDSRSALGMAGVAVRSGARSTIATLWAVQDESTSALIQEFYRLLAQEHLPRAQALRQAQLSLLKNPRYQHPYYWAPFVLIGNWQ